MSDWHIWKPRERFSYDTSPPKKESRKARAKRRRIHKSITPTLTPGTWVDNATPRENREIARAYRSPDRLKLHKDYLVSHTTTKGCSAPVFGQGQGKEKIKALGSRARFKGELEDYEAWCRKQLEQERLAKIEKEAHVTKSNRYRKPRIKPPTKNKPGKSDTITVKVVPKVERLAAKATPIMRQGTYAHDVQSAVNPHKQGRKE